MPDADASPARACLVCEGGLGPATRRPGLMECARCGFVTADLEPSEAELRRVYGRDYFHGLEYADYLAEADSLRLNFERRLATLDAFVGDARGKSLFEIGCAYGFFLDVARARYARARGIDLCTEAVDYARTRLGLDVTAGDYLDHEGAAGTDVFCLWDTIEHLRAPHQYVAKIARQIAPGGLLAITTGDIGSLNARLRGRRWRMIHPPTHLHYFARDSLGRLLDRHGFDVIHVAHPGQARTVKSILYLSLALRAGRPGLYRIAERLPGLGISLTLNLFDIMYVIARRRS